MSALSGAIAQMDSRAVACGAPADGPVELDAVAGLRLLLSGLPVTAEEIGPVLFARVRRALAAMGAGADPMGVVSGALVEAVLIGYYLARAEGGAQ